MQTTMATNRTITRVNHRDFNASGSRFVLNKESQLGKRPVADILASVSNPGQIFQDDALACDLRVGDQTLADAVVLIGDETLFTARDSRQCFLGAFSAVSLKTSPGTLETIFLVPNLFGRFKLAIRAHGHALEAEINSETALRCFNFRGLLADRKMHIENALPVDEFRRTELPGCEFAPETPGHLQLTNHAAFGADGQSSSQEAFAQSQRAGIKTHGRVLLEAMQLIRFTHISRAHFSQRIDDMLAGQARFFADQLVTRVMQVIAAGDALLEGKLRKRIAGVIVLFHRRLQALCARWSKNEFRFDNLPKHISASIL